MEHETEYMEAYFSRRLDEAERQRFEKRCVEDADFAASVALYITTREAIRQQLLDQKKEEWREAKINGTAHTTTRAPVKRMSPPRWLPLAAAACVLLAAGIYFFRQDSPQQAAGNYLEAQYGTLSQTMDASVDTVQRGIAAYNRNAYDSALLLFQTFSKAHADNSDVTQYIGLSYLKKKEYDSALVYFDALAQRTALFSNPGPFLRALTLLQRNNAGDKEAAKQELERIVTQKGEHDTEAAALLKKW